MTSDIKEFYKGQNILITGGTGYLGKLFVAKLLLAMNVKKIYLIVRLKKSTDARQRIVQLYDEEIFNGIDKTKFVERVEAVQGNLTEKDLGISHRDQTLLKENINIVFHCAANMNMNAKLEEAIMTNVNGTSEILNVLKEAKTLKAFVVVSTAYSFCVNSVIEERFYDPPIEAKVLIQLSKNIKSDIFETISPRIIGDWPNTYVFSKAVSENILRTDGQGMPVALFRPTVVTSTVSEPAPGWFGNLYGPLNLHLWCACGILRIFPGKKKIYLDTVPGDYVVNALLCVAWDINKKWKENPENYQPSVFNFSGYGFPLYTTLDEYLNVPKTCKYPPFENALWKPMMIIISNNYIYHFFKLILHSLPAYIHDHIAVLGGKKPRMAKIYSKVDQLSNVLSYFASHEWTVKNSNIKTLWEKLSQSDKLTFQFNIGLIDKNEYFKNQMISLTKYALKTDMVKGGIHGKNIRFLWLRNLLMYGFFAIIFLIILILLW